MPVAFKCGKNDKGGCGYIAPERWLWRCPGCGGFWDCLQVNMDIPGAKSGDVVEGEIVSLQDVVDSGELDVDAPRYKTTIDGVDYVTNGGFAKAGLYLLCGDPGTGKTTLLLSALYHLAKQRQRVLYVTGEQSVKALAGYVKRMKLKLPAHFTAVRETDLDYILDYLDEHEPNLMVLDSISTVETEDFEIGSSAAVRTAITALSKAANEHGTTIIIIAHVTKEGVLAGPKALEHLVDVFLYLAGSKFEKVRYLKCESKNRWGETPRAARFLMTQEGLVDCFKEDHPDAPVADTKEDRPAATAKKKRAPAKKAGSAAPAKKAKPAAPAAKPPKKNDALVDATRLPQINVVLEMPCGVPDCQGKRGVACSTKNGTREAGFHQSRVDRALKKAA